jgi:hypothetical protein
MKTLAALAIAAATTLGMAGCQTYDHHDHYAAGAYIDGYYDDFYGPFDAGYWGDDGVFMYRGADHQFHRDDAGHFRKDAATGYHPAHVPMMRPDNGDHHG